MTPADQGAVTAILYLRVSTKEQAQADGAAEGYSIPAQREACRRKAEHLGAVVTKEFADMGESARSADRAQLQAMLVYVAENPTTYVIVHKVDRLARNRADDVEINLALKAAGVTLVSCTENIDDTPSGMLLHGIMSSIAEFYSRNLANEVIKGSVQKAKGGGTVGKAPTGYLNVRKMENGREIRTVDVDPVRGPLMKWAFDEYSTGKWNLRDLLAEATKRGLTSTPGTQDLRQPAGAVALPHAVEEPLLQGDRQLPGRAVPRPPRTPRAGKDLGTSPGAARPEKQLRREGPQAPPLPQGHRVVRHLRAPPHRLQ